MFIEEPEYVFKHALMQRAVARVYEVQPEFCQNEIAPIVAFDGALFYRAVVLLTQARR